MSYFSLQRQKKLPLTSWKAFLRAVRPDTASLCDWAEQHHMDFVLDGGNEPHQ